MFKSFLFLAVCTMLSAGSIANAIEVQDGTKQGTYQFMGVKVVNADGSITIFYPAINLLAANGQQVQKSAFKYDTRALSANISYICAKVGKTEQIGNVGSSRVSGSMVEVSRSSHLTFSNVSSDQAITSVTCK